MTLDWHTADFPELRAAPPWVMEEMIHAQAALPPGIAAAAGVGPLRATVERVVAAGDEVVVAGCGTSEHAARLIATLLGEAVRGIGIGRVRARQSLDVAFDPPPAGLVIGVSHDGGTRATKLALDAARAAGVATAAITARADGAVAAAAELVLVTPILDRSWCHTVAYSSAILAGAALAHGGEGWEEAAAATLATTLADPAAREAGRRLHPAQRIVTAGLGTDLVAARELALKIEEGARIAATAHHLETLLHGHLAASEATGTRIVLVGGDETLGDRHHRRFLLVAQAVAEIGIPTTAIAAGDLADGLPDAVDVVRLPSADHGPLGRLLGVLATSVAIQLATLGLVDAAGTNPDLIRREQDAYRAAAAVGDESTDW